MGGYVSPVSCLRQSGAAAEVAVGIATAEAATWLCKATTVDARICSCGETPPQASDNPIIPDRETIHINLIRRTIIVLPFLRRWCRLNVSMAHKAFGGECKKDSPSARQRKANWRLLLLGQLLRFYLIAYFLNQR
jgi:hypothetical protein